MSQDCHLLDTPPTPPAGMVQVVTCLSNEGTVNKNQTLLAPAALFFLLSVGQASGGIGSLGALPENPEI